MIRTTNELAAPLVDAMREGAPVFLLTNGADGFPNAALTYALALDARRVRFCIDINTTTYRNLERDAHVGLQIVGAENRVCLVNGAARLVRAQLESKWSPAALFELQVSRVKDQSWRGVAVAPLAYEWDEAERAKCRAMEARLFAEMRADGNIASNVTVYIVRHGEVEHHQSDIGLTARGRAQARAAGGEIASRIPNSRATIHIFHSPVRRVVETAQLLTESLCATLQTRTTRLYPPRPDYALENVRFLSDSSRGMLEPSLLYAEMNTPEFLQSLPPARAEFFRGFWTSSDPMGYWLTHESEGGAETPANVLRRLQERLREICSTGARSERHIFVLTTHSGAMRVLLSSVFGADPGEPNFCEIIALEPAPQTNVLQTTYRGQTVPYALF